MGNTYTKLSNDSIELNIAQKHIKNKEYHKAICSLEQIQDINNDAVLLLGKIYMAACEYDKAKPLFEKLVDTHPEAQYNLGLMYYYGYGHDISQKYKKAFELFDSVVGIHNYIPGIYMLGQCYEYGNGTDKDINAAKKTYNKGITLNCSKCMCARAILYKKTNIHKRVKLLERAIRLDNDMAYYELGKIYYKNDQKIIGMNYLQIAVNKNNIDAMEYLAIIYSKDNINCDKMIELCTKLVDMECINSFNCVLGKLLGDVIIKFHEDTHYQLIKLLTRTHFIKIDITGHKYDLRTIYRSAHPKFEKLINNIIELIKENDELKEKIENYNDNFIYQLSESNWEKEYIKINNDNQIDDYARKRMYVGLIKNYIELKNENDQLKLYFSASPDCPNAELYESIKENWYKNRGELGKPVKLDDT